MSETFEEDLDFEAADGALDDGRALVLNIDGYEGPLHLLLDLARKQKVDLVRISVLELADQYIAFIKSATDLRIDVAADYLVMAAWLAYLKSRLILPREDEEITPEDKDGLASQLAFRLQRLEAMRRAVDGLQRLPQDKTNIFGRGAPEGLRSRNSPLWQASLNDLIVAYGETRSKSVIRHTTVVKPTVLTLEEARVRLRRALERLSSDGEIWSELESLLPSQDEVDADVPRDSVRASSLIAGLELAKDGALLMRQLEAYAPIYVRGSDRKENA